MIDLAHNEAGLEALLEIMAGVRPPGARLLLGLGAVGDRTDELLGRLGEIGAMGADVVAIAHKERYLRGRTREGLDGAAPRRRRTGRGSPTSRRTTPRSSAWPGSWPRRAPATWSG